VHETRHLAVLAPRLLLAHAAKRFETVVLDDRLRLILDDEFGDRSTKDLPTGALKGVVNVVDCLPTQTLSGDVAASNDDRECGDFTLGRFARKRALFVSCISVPVLPHRQRSVRRPTSQRHAGAVNIGGIDHMLARAKRTADPPRRRRSCGLSRLDLVMPCFAATDAQTGVASDLMLTIRSNLENLRIQARPARRCRCPK